VAEAEKINGEMNKFKNRKAAVIKFCVLILVIVIVIFLTAAYVLFAMLKDDTNNDKFYTVSSESENKFSQVIMQAALGQEIKITQDQLNQLILSGIEKFNENQNQVLNEDAERGNVSDLKLEAISLDINPENFHDVYVKMKYKKYEFIAKTKMETVLVEDEKKIILSFSETYIGKIPVSTEFLLKYISKSEELKPYEEQIEITKSTITIPAQYEVDYDNLKLNLEIKSLSTEDGVVKLKTNPLLDQLADYFSGKLFG